MMPRSYRDRFAMKKLILAAVLLMFLPIVSAYAVKVQSLYQAEVAVSSQSAEERSRAMTEGLVEVLSKITSDTQIEKNPIIKTALQKADYYVQEYKYSLPEANSSHYLLQIHYDEKDIRRLLKKAGTVQWGENRPLILVWLAITNESHAAQLVGNEDSADLLREMKLQGKKYGLPLIFPMMDMEDVSQVTPDDVNKMSIQVLKDAARRYTPDAILVGKIDALPQHIESTWQFVLGDKNWEWRIVGKSEEEVVASIVTHINQALSKSYGMTDTNTKEEHWVKLEILNVAETTDLSEVTKYLKQLSPVVQVELSQITEDIAEFAVLIKGSIQAFERQATIGQRLILKSDPADTEKLSYEWVHTN